MPDWYVYDAGAEIGPIGQHALIAVLLTRNLDSVRVWREDFETWMRPRDVPELASVLPSRPGASVSPMPAPPRKERSGTGKKKTAIRSRVAASRALHAGAAGIPKGGSGYRFAWAQVGALAGLIIFGAGVLLEWAGVKIEPWGIAGPGHDLVHLCASAGLAALIGFIAGAVRDAGPGKADGAQAPRPARKREGGTSALRRKVNKTWPVNFLAAHWRGELPLWVSFWVFGFIGNIVIAILPTLAITLFEADRGYKPTAIFSATVAIWAGIFMIAVWQTAGVWRSAAGRALPHAEARDPLPAAGLTFWAGLARIVAVVSFARLLGAFATEGLPQVGELYKIAFQDDPDIPSYTIRLMRDGTEAEITGGFKYGLTDDFTAIVNTAPRLKVVHLDSIGGRLGEGEKLFTLIRQHGFNTYVSSRCLSACTLAFAGGHERFLLKGAALGFHKGGFPGVSDDEFDSLQHKVFTLAGFDSAFIERALSTPHSDLWKPPTDVLVAARVVTGVTDGTVFAASGHGANFTKETAAASLARATPIFQAMQARFPAQFSSILDDYYEAIQKGKTEAETVRALRGRVRPFIASLISQADDDVLIDYNRILIDQYSYLYAKNPSACYAFAAGMIPQANTPADLSSELAQRKQAVEERVIATAVMRPEASRAAATPLFAKLRKALIAKGFTEADFSLLDQPAVERSKQAQYCRRRILFLIEIGRLPAPEGATILRRIFASK